MDTCTCALHLQLFQDSSDCPCAPTLCCSLHTKCCWQVRGQLQHLHPWAQSNVCNLGPNAFTRLSWRPSWQFLHSCTETRLSSPSAVLHPSNSLTSHLSGILPLLPESYLRLCCMLSLTLVPILSIPKHFILSLGWLHLPWGKDYCPKKSLI